MQMLKRRSTLTAAVTLMVGLALGVGITSLTNRSQAASADKSVAANSANEDKNTPDATSDEWDPFREMERMHEEIDRSIRRATEQFRLEAPSTAFSRDLGYSSSLDLRDRGDHYELRTYLPDAETQNVKVTNDGDRQVRVSISHRKQQKKEKDGTQAMFSELGTYEHLVTLPGPAKMKEMKIDHRDHEVVITIPKA
jgi:HSP20 family molecular chaperone IbpA